MKTLPRRIRGKLLGCQLGALTLFAVTPACFAAVAAADSFLTGGANYTAGALNLFGQGPAAVGFSGGWLSAYGAAASPDVLAAGLTYPGMTGTGGGAVQYRPTFDGRGGRLLTAPYTNASTGVVYFSFLMKLDSTGSDYRAFELHQGGFDDGGNRKLQIATGEGSSNFSARLLNGNGGDGTFAGDLGASDTNVNLFVGKITFSATANADEIRIWRNPSSLLNESSSSTPTFVKTGFDFAFDRVSFARFNSAGDGFQADEVRIASSWTEVTTALDPTDSDGDGLPNSWEIANQLDPDSAAGVNGAAGDVEPDGSPNLQEYTRNTNPRNSDTDGDGLFDGPESGTGTFVSASNTGTNPLIVDTDGDFLLDGAEVTIHLTNPNLRNTDSDSANDATEVSSGSNPNNAASQPSTAKPNVVGLEYFDYTNGTITGKSGGEFFDYDNTTLNDSFVGHTNSKAIWTTQFGTPPVVDCGKLATRDSGAIRQLNGPLGGGTNTSLFGDITAAGSRVLYARVKVTRKPGATYSGLSFYRDGSETFFFGVPASLNNGVPTFGLEEPGGAPTYSAGSPVDNISVTLVAKIDQIAGTAKLWINPNFAITEPAANAEITALNSTNLQANTIRLASGGTGNTLFDELIVTTTWAALNTSPPVDSDGDTLRDSWELAYTPLLTTFTSGGNNDSDTLANATEQILGTNPLLGDSDGDTILDSTEVTAGTDPCSADTDGDGLADNVEITLGTNPLLVDSDGDSENDGFEVSQGTNPLLASSSSAAFGLAIVDGLRDASYGPAKALQTVETSFSDNASELNAAYAKIINGKLFLMVTGNLSADFNKLEIFVDSKTGGSSTYISPGNDGTVAMNGMKFDTTFQPDFQLIARRGGDKFDLDFANLITPSFSSYASIFGASGTGSGQTGTGINLQPIRVAFDNSNTAGVLGGTGAADPLAAADATTGLEFAIDLADLGSPTGSIRVMVLLNNSGHDFLSNQSLAGLPAPQANLGSPSSVDFSTFAGDQFFTIEQNSIRITGVKMLSANTQIQLTVSGLTIGRSYRVMDSTTLASFADIASSQFTAGAATQDITLSVTPGTVPKRFFRIRDIP